MNSVAGRARRTPDQIAADTLLDRAQELESAGFDDEARGLRLSVHQLRVPPAEGTGQDVTAPIGRDGPDSS